MAGSPDVNEQQTIENRKTLSQEGTWRKQISLPLCSVHSLIITVFNSFMK